MFPHLRAVDVADALAQLQLELARLLEAVLEELRDSGLRFRPPDDDLDELVRSPAVGFGRHARARIVVFLANSIVRVW